MMFGEMAKPPTCLRVVNFFRVIQFVAKMAIYWWLFIECFKGITTGWQTAQAAFAVPFFIWYEFWRFFSTCRRINLFHIQYSFAIFDITAGAILSTLYVDVTGIGNNIQRQIFHVTSIVYACYLILPVIIFVAWIAAYCKMRQAAGQAQGLMGKMADAVSSMVTIQLMAIGSWRFRILFYINIIVGVLLAAITLYGEESLIFDGIRPDVFLILYIFQLADLLLNIIYDIIVSCMKSHPMAMLLSEPPVPGLGCFSCSCFSPAPEFGGMQNPLLA